MHTWARAMLLRGEIITFRIFLYRLLQGRDVPEGAEEEDDDVSLVLHRGDLKEQP